ncbi:MAG: NADPH-dependent FMN reductase [Vicingaceae bacterium]
MEKYTIISASNRQDNKTQLFADLCSKLLTEMGIDNQVYNLQQLPVSLIGEGMYDFDNSPMADIVEKYLKPVNKLVFVIPEYNGSFPGVLKLFIDAIHPRYFKGKQAALLGIASGRSGNVRGMEHLTGILHYLKMEVFHNKLPISSIDRMLSNDMINDDETIELIRSQMMAYRNF